MLDTKEGRCILGFFPFAVESFWLSGILGVAISGEFFSFCGWFDYADTGDWFGSVFGL